VKLKLDLSDYRVDGKAKAFKMAKAPTKTKDLYKDKAHYEELLGQFRDEINELQEMMLAHKRYGLLIIFQAMDAAGKDGTIQHVMSGVNAHGVEVNYFKRPSDDELDHDYLWRHTLKMPARGKLGIFNRSYYEEVLICRVHPSIVQNVQHLPEEVKGDMKRLYAKRLEDIANYEAYCHRNGFRIVKFMLNVSKAEQKKRFLDRIETPSKNWKFNAADVSERQHWDEYMAAYEEAINTTANERSPWYVVPADDKRNLRLIVSAAILHEMQRMHLSWPVLPKEQRALLESSKAALLAEK
jgi:PPK2 family polyphosphate:nucleotide phosphotransferase